MMRALKFRVVLDTKEDVFCDLVVREDQNFEVMYDCIVSTFKFGGGVMSSFYMSNENWDKGEEITLLDMSENGEGALIMNKCQIKDFITEDRQRIVLVYDFMRMWCFLLELIDSDEADDETKYPFVSMTFGNPPKEESKELSDFTFGDADANSDFDDEEIEDEIGGMFDDLEEFDDSEDF